MVTVTHLLELTSRLNGSDPITVIMRGYRGIDLKKGI